VKTLRAETRINAAVESIQRPQSCILMQTIVLFFKDNVTAGHIGLKGSGVYTYKVRGCIRPLSGKYIYFSYLISELSRPLRKKNPRPESAHLLSQIPGYATAKMARLWGSQGALRGRDSPPVTMPYVFTVEHQISYISQASDLAPLSSVYTRITFFRFLSFS